MRKSSTYKSMRLHLQLWAMLLLLSVSATATTYIVSTKSALQTRMNAALPGDTVTVADGTYNNWGNISFTNNNGSSSSAWIVLRAQTFRGVVFTGTAYLSFKGTHVRIDGFTFANGNAGTNAVISFRSSSSNLANYCRISNIVIDNFNTPSADSSTENEWVGIFGTHNRVDHCNFINKYNARATIVVWYSSTTYPAPANSTYHRIDSNYFAGRSYQGANGGETIRVGDSNGSRTNGYNTVEYNLFENCTQVEPEIISNKSNFNTYRYNTFKNCQGGLTLRHGRYCDVYSNFFIVDVANVTRSYGIRIIDKGHRVYNNYMEGLSGNKNSLTSLRCPIILYNGLSSVNDTADAAKASGYFPADSSVVAFNTIVNCSGGAGIVLGFTDGSNNTYQPKGITVANNLVKMTTGQAAYKPSANTALTYFAEGNMYDAPNGVGLSSSAGFTGSSLAFGQRFNGILSPPSLAQDAAANTASYSTLLKDLDALSQTRTSNYDVGCTELNGTGNILTYPLDSTLVGAGKPLMLLALHLHEFDVRLVNKTAMLTWKTSGEANMYSFNIEWSGDGVNYTSVGSVKASQTSKETAYTFQHKELKEGRNFYRLKMIYNDGKFVYSPVKSVSLSTEVSVNIYPNPASNSIKIKLSGTLEPSAQVVVSDALGSKVKSGKLISNTMIIPIQNLKSGLYTIQIITNSGVISNHPFIVSSR